MERYFTVIAAIGAAALIVGAIFAEYQLFCLVKADAVCRGLKHPNFWGIFSATGNSQSGLIMYLIGRRRFPIVSMTEEQKSFIERCKKKIGVGIIFIVIGAIMCVWGTMMVI